MADSNTSRNNGKRRSDDDDDQNMKKIKNSTAAKKSREKKKVETENLKKKNEELIQNNKSLTLRKEQLEQQLKQCIEEIMKHKNSGCKLPKNVTEIIQSTCYTNDFIPVGTKTTVRQNKGQNTNSNEDELSQETDHQNPVRGLFSGNEFPTTALEQRRNRNLSSRSPSRSPASSSEASQCQSPPTNSNSNSNSITKIPFNPDWAHLHQITSVKDCSHQFSPAQTVPNIDEDLFSCPDKDQKCISNEFPPTEEALKYAHEDQGITEESTLRGGYEFHPKLHLAEDKQPLVSYNFAPNLTPSDMQPIQNQYELGQNVSFSVGNTDYPRPSSSNPSTVSMNHTAELLSQAISNFEASEISEDLKKEFARVTANQSTNESYVTGQNDLTMDEVPRYIERSVDNIEIQQQFSQNPEPAQHLGNNSQIPVESLLKLAEGHERIVLNFQGKDYILDYEAIKQLTYLKQNNSQNTFILADSCSSELPEQGNKPGLLTSSFPQSSGSNSFPQSFGTQFSSLSETGELVSNALLPNFYPPSVHFSNMDQGMTSLPQQNQLSEEQVQDIQLPTTVLSIIQEDSLAISAQTPTLSSTDSSIDYSKNVVDLPSLSLTEDHTNIFEKKRRHYDK